MNTLNKLLLEKSLRLVVIPLDKLVNAENDSSFNSFYTKQRLKRPKTKDNLGNPKACVVIMYLAIYFFKMWDEPIVAFIPKNVGIVFKLF